MGTPQAKCIAGPSFCEPWDEGHSAGPALHPSLLHHRNIFALISLLSLTLESFSPLLPSARAHFSSQSFPFFFKVPIEFVAVLLLFMFWVFWLQGIELFSPALEGEVLTAGPPGKSQAFPFILGAGGWERHSLDPLVPLWLHLAAQTLLFSGERQPCRGICCDFLPAGGDRAAGGEKTSHVSRTEHCWSPMEEESFLLGVHPNACL